MVNVSRCDIVKLYLAIRMRLPIKSLILDFLFFSNDIVFGSWPQMWRKIGSARHIIQLLAVNDLSIHMGFLNFWHKYLILGLYIHKFFEEYYLLVHKPYSCLLCLISLQFKNATVIQLFRGEQFGIRCTVLIWSEFRCWRASMIQKAKLFLIILHQIYFYDRNFIFLRTSRIKTKRNATTVG